MTAEDAGQTRRVPGARAIDPRSPRLRRADGTVVRVGVAVGLALLAACDRGTPGVTPTGTPTPAVSTAAAPRGHALGIGEPREPQPFTLDQRLLDAVSRGDRATLERALERGGRVDAKDDLGRSTVLLAVLDAGDLELVELLRGRGAALDEPDSGGRTALSFAAAAGRLDIVRYLVAHGAQVDRRDVQHRTPLFHAALADHAEVVDFLREHGADVDARDQFGDTPLIVACAKGNSATATLLLARGADPSLTDQEGRTARERAAPGTTPCLNPSAPPR